jgi:hypothetical protein
MTAAGNWAAVATTNASTAWADPSLSRASNWPACCAIVRVRSETRMARVLSSLLIASVVAWPPADLGEDRRRNADEAASLVGDRDDRARTDEQGWTLMRVCERVESLRVEDYRFGHWRRTRASSAGGMRPCSAFHSARSFPSRSRSSSCAMARATKPERPRDPTLRRSSSARSPGTLTESFAAGWPMGISYHGRRKWATTLAALGLVAASDGRKDAQSESGRKRLCCPIPPCPREDARARLFSQSAGVVALRSFSAAQTIRLGNAIESTQSASGGAGKTERGSAALDRLKGYGASCVLHARCLRVSVRLRDFTGRMEEGKKGSCEWIVRGWVTARSAPLDLRGHCFSLQAAASATWRVWIGDAALRPMPARFGHNPLSLFSFASALPFFLSSCSILSSVSALFCSATHSLLRHHFLSRRDDAVGTRCGVIDAIGASKPACAEVAWGGECWAAARCRTGVEDADGVAATTSAGG